LAAVERHLQAVGELQTLSLIRKLVFRDQIAAPNFETVEA
jgi:hypothetical protein